MEHLGLSYEQIGNRLDPPVSRTTVWRWVHEQWRLNPEKMAALAEAMNLSGASDLYRRPERPSMDALANTMSDELYQTALDIVRRLAKQAS